MDTRSETLKRLVITIAVVCVTLGVATTVLAVPPTEFLRVERNQTFSGECCFSWGETVSVTEPSLPVPVVVTWSTDYVATDPINIGVSVNGHPCLSDRMLGGFAPPDGTFNSRIFQFILLPTDGLMKGTNTITLCGGGQGPTGSITLGFNTLAARTSK